MDQTFYESARSVWRKPAFDGEFPLPSPADMERYKKMLDIFQVGDYYFFIFNLATAEFEYISAGVTQVLGYDQTITAKQIVEAIHPDDRDHFVRFEGDYSRFVHKNVAPENFRKYKLQYDFRIRCMDGAYKRILHQTLVYHQEGKEVLQTICVHTDITHLKKNNIPEFAIVGYDGEPNYRFRDFYLANSDSFTMQLTPREHEILGWVLEPKTSQEIAALLNISEHTVKTHRKRILSKTGCRNMRELMLKCKSL